jgi:hypothetical protein
MSDYNSAMPEHDGPTADPTPKMRSVSIGDLEGPMVQLKQVVAMADTIEEGLSHGTNPVESIHSHALRGLVDVLRVRVNTLEQIIMGDEADPI